MDETQEKKDLLNLDKVFPFFHNFGKFDFLLVIPSTVDFNEGNPLLFPPAPTVASLLTKYGYAIITRDEYSTYFAELTDRGREAKLAGGHFAYLEKVSVEEKKEHDRRQKKDNSEEFDGLIKRWTYKSRYLPYIISIGALTVSILAYFKPENKKTQEESSKQKSSPILSKTKIDSLPKTDTALTPKN